MASLSRSSRTRAVIVIFTATALSLLISALVLRRYDSDLLIAAIIACPLIGLISGTALGAYYGRLSFLHTALILPCLYLVRFAAPPGDPSGTVEPLPANPHSRRLPWRTPFEAGPASPPTFR